MSFTSKEKEILPKNVRPLHYAIELAPDLTTFLTDGTVVIDLEVLEDSPKICINANQIKISDVELKRDDESPSLKPTSSSQYGEHVYNMVFGEKLQKGEKVSLTMRFQSPLNEKYFGFYRCSFPQNGNSTWMAATQMEPIDARRAFPCFDEPALKATFDVTLIADQEYTCLSNMNVIAETALPEGKKKVDFATTPLMSTYLIAFVVGNLEYRELTTFRVPIRVYTPIGFIEDSQFSLDLAVKTLKFYEDAFDCPFPLPKMDMVGLYDAGGAMENWGLCIFSFRWLMFDEKNGPAAEKKRIAYCVTHELAHQWFGNIVSMEFWDGLWLNEGFATWMAWYAVEAFYPEWNNWQSFVNEALQKALELDSLRSSHPVEVPITKTSMINQIFDEISYQKGSCVIRMVATYLGEDVFLKGIKLYLKKHEYGNTKTKDLWDALSETSSQDINALMSPWTTKIGFPVLTVTETSEGIHIKQNRYLQSTDIRDDEDSTIFPVMLGLRTQDGTQDNIVFNSRSIDVALDTTEFFKLNANHCGFYRTLYTPERLSKLGQTMKSELLSVEDRIGLLADCGALAMSGQQKTSALLDLLADMGEESNGVVWSQILARLDAVEDTWKFEEGKVKLALQAFTRKIVAPKALELGWDFKEGEDLTLAQQKAAMFAKAGLAGDPTIVKAAQKLFQSFINGDKNAIRSNIQIAVYSIALKYGSAAEFDALLKTYRESTKQADRDAMLRGFGNTQDTQSIDSLLAMMLSDELSPPSLMFVFPDLANHAAPRVWSWMKENWTTLDKKFGSGLGLLRSYVAMIVRALGEKEHLEDVEGFFEGIDTEAYRQKLEQGLDSLKAKIEWVQRDREDVKEWLFE